MPTRLGGGDATLVNLSRYPQDSVSAPSPNPISLPVETGFTFTLKTQIQSHTHILTHIFSHYVPQSCVYAWLQAPQRWLISPEIHLLQSSIASVTSTYTTHQLKQGSTSPLPR